MEIWGCTVLHVPPLWQQQEPSRQCPLWSVAEPMEQGAGWIHLLPTPNKHAHIPVQITSWCPSSRVQFTYAINSDCVLWVWKIQEWKHESPEIAPWLFSLLTFTQMAKWSHHSDSRLPEDGRWHRAKTQGPGKFLPAGPKGMMPLACSVSTITPPITFRRSGLHQHSQSSREIS